MKKIKTILSILFVGVITISILAFLLIPKDVAVLPVTQEEVANARAILNNSLVDARYTYVDFLSRHEGVLMPEVIYAAIREGTDDGTLAAEETANFIVNVETEGLYSLSAEYGFLERILTGITLSVQINGERQYLEASTIDLPVMWQDQTKEFPVDSFGDETMPEQEPLTDKYVIDFYNNTYISDTPLLFWLEAGENQIEITNTSSRTIMLSNLSVKSKEDLPTYEEYINQWNSVNATELKNINATEYVLKNSSYVQLGSTTDVSVYPADPVNKKINILSLEKSGNEAIYNIQVEQEGFYHIALHSQIINEDFSNFSSFRINGKAPFKEALSYPLKPFADTKWHNQYLADKDGNPYKIYLKEGEHTLSIRMETRPVASALRDLQLIVDHVNKFSLDIKKVTGKEVDKNRTWRFSRYIPETADYLIAYDILLREIAYSLTEYSSKGLKSSVLSSLTEAIGLLDKLLEKPDDIPLYIENLAGNDVSILLLSGRVMDNLLEQSISLNSIYLYGEDVELPQENASLATAMSASMSRLWASFVSPKYVVRNDPEVLNIWVNNSVVHVDTLQKLADTRFTPETGIKVRVSIMPDAQKLVFASAAKTNPDIGLGLESYMPFDLALRGALYDMTQFDDFWKVADRFASGTLLSYVFNDGVYALPESMDFNALVYREDIFENLNLEAPNTWEDVGLMMSELQRFDMSFYMPIASGDGYKWFYQTAPLIYQNNGLLYQTDGLGTAIDRPEAVKGITMLGDLFTTYALSEQVPVFFNSFRFGQTPIGITDSANYLLIKEGAPELTGQWKLALPPGTEQEDGSISRWFVANGRGGIIFENSDKKEQSWEFMKWWLSEDVQADFAFKLQSTFGILWLSSNLEALANTPLPDEDLKIVMESVEWIRDTPRSPGQYMLERSLSNIWNTMVFDGTPAQVAIDRRAIEIQREFRRKMMEFGFIDTHGNKLREYEVREIDWIVEKLREENLK